MIFFIAYIYRAVTRAHACVVRRSNVLECLSTMTRMSCSMHSGLLDGRCLGRRCRVSLEQLGALCGGCVCQRWDYYIYILYHVLTDDAWADELCIFFLFFFFHTVQVIFFIHRTIAIQPFHELNVYMCLFVVAITIATACRS